MYDLLFCSEMQHTSKKLDDSKRDQEMARMEKRKITLKYESLRKEYNELKKVMDSSGISSPDQSFSSQPVQKVG
jgi:hypothetical protein